MMLSATAFDMPLLPRMPVNAAAAKVASEGISTSEAQLRIRSSCSSSL